MAKKSSFSLAIVGAGIGVAVAIYVLKKYTKVLDPIVDAIQDQKINKKLSDLSKEAKVSYEKVAAEVQKILSEESKQVSKTGKKVVKTAKKLEKRAEKEVSKKVKATKRAAVSTMNKVVAAEKKTVKKASKVVKKVASELSEKAAQILKSMEAAREYTQTELATVSQIPYRTVRRYVEDLVKSGKVAEKGYGKGKRFVKK